MDFEKIEELKGAGFSVGDASDFLELTPEEVELVDPRKTREIAFGGAKCGESV